MLADYVGHGFVDAADGSVVLACSPETEALVFANGFASDARDRVGAVACPVVLVRGSSSRDVSAERLERLAAALPDARRAELADLGHLGPLERPAVVARSVLQFLATARA
ncbi:MAG: alpha/beta hydrolase [Actinomycetota bacterium]|nr:alpha/beta hydrolase [Actinomycetota bacterium]